MNKMTADELQRIVVRLSNQAWVRHWLHYNRPEQPAVMAIQVVEYKKALNGKVLLTPVECKELEKLGFVMDDNIFFRYVYLIERQLNESS